MRTKPNIGRTDSPVSRPNTDDDALGCVWVPLVIVIGYIVLSAIARVTSNMGSKLDQAICYGALICFVIVLILGARDMIRDSQALAAEKQQWKKASRSAQVAIVSRHGGTWDDGYRFHTAYWLELEPGPDQSRLSPSQNIIRVRVSQYLYEKLEKRAAVRIYYKPETPLTFLLEEEL